MVVWRRAGGGQSAAPRRAAPLRARPAPFGGENEQQRSASPQDGENTEEMLGGGRRGHAARGEAHGDALHQMPLLRSHRKGSLFRFIFSGAVFASVPPI